MTSPQKKAAKTRAMHRAAEERWRTFDEPANRRIEMLINNLIQQRKRIDLRWLGQHRLKHGAQYGTLLKVRCGGKIWSVMVEGYKRPQLFPAAHWEVLL